MPSDKWEQQITVLQRRFGSVRFLCIAPGRWTAYFERDVKIDGASVTAYGVTPAACARELYRTMTDRMADITLDGAHVRWSGVSWESVR